MPHGGPDWGTLGPLKTVYTLEDLAELAARLSSINTFDRRGNVMWLDDFEHGIEKWHQSGFPPGWEVEWSSVEARNGSFSCLLKTAAVSGASVTIHKYFSIPVASNISLELSVLNEANWDLIAIILDYFDGIRKHEAELRYSYTTHKFIYSAGDEGWLYSGITMKLSAIDTLFHTIKLVIDIANDRYKRLVVNNQEVDLSAHSLGVGDDDAGPYLSASFTVWAKEDAIAKAYIDDVILTQNEP